ncbi:matrixin family metalloprotease [Candidatus Acetothermia bacterium]|nr:matrixin family metalloprotease [Candidatus Acetothermia bacterium]MBI3643754.1 matrixin family metalloprotease [Candidatus Acetothermia bacterium]
MLKTKRWLVWGLFLILALPVSVSAFTINHILDNGTQDPSDDLHDAARWSDISGTYVTDNVRGLGGGLEYSIATDFYDKILPSIVDQTKPTKDEVYAAIRRDFDRWASGSPLKFTDVTNQIFAIGDAAYPGSGAEIDIFAVPHGDLAFRHNTLAGNTFVIFSSDKPMGTNGQQLPGRTISSADIYVNTDAMYFMNPNDPAVQQLQSQGQPLNHLESLIFHEISHAIGLDHPDEFSNRNFDTDTDPNDAMNINCQDPLQGLQLSPSIAVNAIATSGGSGSYRLSLTPDDLGGRAFLYPSCSGSSAPSPTPTPTPTPSPTPTPPPSNGGAGLSHYDTNKNCKLEDTEFFALVDQWIGGSADNSLFFSGVDAWIGQSNICSASAAGTTAGKPQIELSYHPSSSSALFAVQGAKVTAVQVEVFSLDGRLIARERSDGDHLVWHLNTLQGKHVASGTYLYRLTTRDAVGKTWASSIQKLILLRSTSN